MTNPIDAGAKITQAEMFEMFGESMPIEAVTLLWEADGSMTVGEMRAALRKLALSPAPVGDVLPVAELVRYEAWPEVGPFNAYYTRLEEDPEGRLVMFDQAADALTSQARLLAIARAELEEARKVLEPFNCVIPYDFYADDEKVKLTFKARAFRAVVAFLAKSRAASPETRG